MSVERVAAIVWRRAQSGASSRRWAALRPGRRGALLLVGALLILAAWTPATAGANPTTGSISGTVTEAAGGHAAIEGLCVLAYEAGGENEGFAETEASGKYTIADLPPGSYEVSFTTCYGSSLNFAPRYYPEKTKASEAGTVKVEAGVETKADAEMHAGGKVFEEYVLGGKGQPLAGVCATAEPEKVDEGEAGFATSTGGEFTIAGLATASYTVEFRSCGGDVVAGFYDEDATTGVTSSRSQATPLAVKAEGGAMEPATIEELLPVHLEAGAEIEGTITEAEGKPVTAPICVTAWPAEGGEVREAVSEDGHYLIEGLTTGSYKLEFEECVESGERPVWRSQYYDGVQSEATATPVAVTAGVEPAVPAQADVRLVSEAATKPANTAAPTIAGTPAVGGALSCSTGSWTGTPAPSFSYRWLRNGATIGGAGASSYTVQAADEAKSLTCEVTATNEIGSASATSAPVGVLARQLVTSPPAEVGIASVVGTAKVKSATATFRLHCGGAGACHGSLKLTARVTEIRDVRRHGRRHTVRHVATVTIGSATFALAADTDETLTVHLTGAGSSAVRGAGRHGLDAKVSGSDVNEGTMVLQEAVAKRRRHRRR